jgi:hypothetical protein
MYYEDLSAYSYLEVMPPFGCVNIGWLDIKYKYTSGIVSENIVSKLSILCKCPARLTRGAHRCQFCDPSKPAMGNGEVLIASSKGIVYAAPVLICHYIGTHHYRPPNAFLLAVLDAPLENYEQFVNSLTEQKRVMPL